MIYAWRIDASNSTTFCYSCSTIGHSCVSQSLLPSSIYYLMAGPCLLHGRACIVTVYVCVCVCVSAAEWQVMCIFKALNPDPQNRYQGLDLNNFLCFYEVIDFKWEEVGRKQDVRESINNPILPYLVLKKSSVLSD